MNNCWFIERFYRLFFLLFILLPGVCCAVQESKAAQLKKELEAAQSDTARARLCGALAWELKFTNMEEALTLAEKEISLGLSLRQPSLAADGFRVKALTLVIAEKIAEGMPLYDSALAYARRAGRSDLEASCYSLMAGMYGDHGDFDKAIELYAKGLEIAERSQNPRMIAVLGNNLAEVYQSEGRNTQMAQKYFLIALSNSVRMKNWPAAGMNAANLAKEYFAAGEPGKAGAQLRQAVDLMKKDTSNAYQYATTAHVLASIYYDLGQWNEAERYALLSLRIMDALRRPDNALRALTVLAQLYLAKGDVKKGEEFAQRLLRDAQAQQAKLYIRDGYKVLAELEKQRGNYRAALDHFALYKQWNDSVFELRREQNISNMEALALLRQKETEVRYETEKKTLENQALRKRNSDLVTERFIVLGACLVFLVLSVLLFFSYRNKNRANRALEEEKRVVERQAREKTVLVNEIHHRVKNNLTMLKGLLYLQAQNTGNAEAKKILAATQARIHSLALVHQSLYAGANNELLDLVSLLGDILSELISSSAHSGLEVDFTISGNCRELTIAQAIPLSLIVNELATNSLKYAFAGQGAIAIHIREEKDRLVIFYSDNGKGLPAPFDPAGGGFGSRLIDILSRQLNAVLSYEGSEGNCQFRLEMPL